MLALNRRTLAARVTALVAALSLLVIASPAMASNYTSLFANHYGPLYSGGTYTNYGHYHQYIDYLSANSWGTAYSGVWVSNGSGVRVSADSYCNQPGCTVYAHWYGPFPNGYPSLHNHGNASPSYFSGAVGWY